MIDAVAPTALQPGLHGLKIPVGLAVGTVNAYLIEGDPLTLIDAGTHGEESFAALSAGLSTSGYQVSDLRRLIITHHHTDHAGGAARIAEVVRDSGAELTILCHPFTVPHLIDPAQTRGRASDYADQIFGVLGGASAREREFMRQSDAYLLTLVRPTYVSGTLNEGDSVDLGGDAWQVLHNPGHASDQITFFQSGSRAWIAADHLIGHSKSNPLLEPPEHDHAPRVPRLIEYERELARIAALKPTIGYSGHGEPILNVSALIAERIERRRARTDKLAELIGQTPAEQRTLSELARRFYPKATLYECYLTFSETLGHLDFLVQAQKIRQERRSDGAILWQPNGI